MRHLHATHRIAAATRPPIALEEKAFLTYQAMSNSDDIVLLLECDGSPETNDAVIIAANDAFRRASGYSTEQLLGRVATDLFPVRSDAQSLLNAISGPGSLRSELTCSRVDGETFTLGMHLMPAPVRTAGKACFALLGRDISAAFRARKTHDSIQHLLAKVFSCVDVAVAIISPATRIVMTNRHLDLLLGYEPNGLVGRCSLDLVAPGSRDSVAAIVKRQRESGGDVTYSTFALRKDGSEIPVRTPSVIGTTSGTTQFRIVTLRARAAGLAAIRSQSVGRIKLVGLDEVRAALADRWPAAAQRVMATAEVVIKRHCGPQDSYSRVDDTSFLVCFGALSETECSFRAAMIGREIRKRLIGQGEDPETAYVRSIAAVVRLPEKVEFGRLAARQINGWPGQTT